MHDFSNLWLGALYVLTFGVCFAAIAWSDRHDRREPTAPAPFYVPPPANPAEATALEALSAMRALVHQIGNTAHELALEFDLALNTTDEQQQQEVRDMLRDSLQRFLEITHQVAQLDTRLSGNSPIDRKRN
jgi:hypothetical protein